MSRSEKLRYLRNVEQREGLYHEAWCPEEGDCSITVSARDDRIFVRVQKEFEGRLEVEMSRTEASEMIRHLESYLQKKKAQPDARANADGRPACG